MSSFAKSRIFCQHHPRCSARYPFLCTQNSPAFHCTHSLYTMLKLLSLLSLALPLAQAAETTICTGFNHGAFWGSGGNAKTAEDFKAGFGYAHDLKSAVPFNSARLFTCKQQGTDDDYSQAFDAAVETKTNLLLGMWISPARRSDPLDDLIKAELSALGKGFEKHGQALADLVIGLSVGSEDVFRWEDDKENVGVAATEVTAAIKKVKDTIASSKFAKYMASKPIGHVDTAKHSIVDGADFYGITVYPYWNKDPVANAKVSFKGTLDDVISRAKGKPIWIAEVGWPFQGASQGASQADAQSLQQFWTDVGCTIIGKYTTFWFELIKDSESNQPDWGMIDSETHKARIDLSCPGSSQPSASAPPASSLPAIPLPSSVVSGTSTGQITSTVKTSLQSSAAPSTAPSVASSTAPSAVPSALPSSQSSPTSVTSSHLPSSPPPVSGKSTVHVTTTLTTIVQPSGALVPSGGGDDSTLTTTITSTVWVPPSSIPPDGVAASPLDSRLSAGPAITPAAQTAIIPGIIPWCVTHVASNGQLLPVAGGPAGKDGKCPPAPPATAAPSSSVLPKDVKWCVTVADIGWNGEYMPLAGHAADSNGKCDTPPIYTGLPYTTGKPGLTPAPAPSLKPALPVPPSPSGSASAAPSSCKAKSKTAALPPASSTPASSPPSASGTAKPPIAPIPVTSANSLLAPPAIPAPSNAPPASKVPPPASSAIHPSSSSAPAAVPSSSAAPAPSSPAAPPPG